MGTTRPTNSSIVVDLASIVNSRPRIQGPEAQYSPKRQNIVVRKKRPSASTRVASIGDLHHDSRERTGCSHSAGTVAGMAAPHSERGVSPNARVQRGYNPSPHTAPFPGPDHITQVFLSTYHGQQKGFAS